MKKVIFFAAAFIAVIITGCATTNGVKSHCQAETARFLSKNLDPDTIKIEDASIENYSGNNSWYFWTAITPDGSRYKCQAFSGDNTRYCRELKINKFKKVKSSGK